MVHNLKLDLVIVHLFERNRAQRYRRDGHDSKYATAEQVIQFHTNLASFQKYFLLFQILKKDARPKIPGK